jgi:hypothetical protein
MDIYIIGTDHKHQFGPCTAFKATVQSCDAFASFLREQCRSLKIKTLAEEMSADARQKWDISKTVPESVALELGVEHADCDLSEAERSRLGILNEGDVKRNSWLFGHSKQTVQKNIVREYEKKEDEWIRRLSKLPHYPVLFVCGYDHSSSLQRRAIAHGMRVHVIVEKWTPNNTAKLTS